VSNNGHNVLSLYMEGSGGLCEAIFGHITIPSVTCHSLRKNPDPFERR